MLEVATSLGVGKNNQRERLVSPAGQRYFNMTTTQTQLEQTDWRRFRESARGKLGRRLLSVKRGWACHHPKQSKMPENVKF